MQRKLVTRGYEMNCEPRVMEDGVLATHAEVTKLGFDREAGCTSNSHCIRVLWAAL